jgi:transposase
MKDFIIVGVDVSKATLDVCLKPSGITMKIDNSICGFKSLFQELKKSGLEVRNSLVVMEHTGSYSYRLEKFLISKSVNYCKVAALQIKRSMGIVRGKNDKIDAVRIAEYGWLRREKLRVDEPLSENLEKLKQLLSLRSKLVKDRSGYKCRQKEIKSSYDYKKTDPINQSNTRMINAFTQEIKVAEKGIRQLIDSDKTLKQVSLLIQSIRGVGLIVAAYMICYTNNFKRFTNARKFNCYAGIAPFAHESGTSIKGRMRVSHLANKELKTLLNLAAWTAIQYDPELRKYYNRRVAQGMKKMSCLNIIRSKIVSRIFAVAKRETPFVHLPIAA